MRKPQFNVSSRSRALSLSLFLSLLYRIYHLMSTCSGRDLFLEISHLYTLGARAYRVLRQNVWHESERKRAKIWRKCCYTMISQHIRIRRQFVALNQFMFVNAGFEHRICCFCCCCSRRHRRGCGRHCHHYCIIYCRQRQLTTIHTERHNVHIIFYTSCMRMRHMISRLFYLF